MRNYDQDVQRSTRYIAEFEDAVTICCGRVYRHTLFHQADLNVFQKVLRASFEDLTHDGRTRFCGCDYHVQVEWRRLKDQLPTGSMTARLNRGLPLLTVKNEICDERLVIGRIFDDLEFKKLGGRSICKFHRVFIEHWPESIGADAEDNGRMTRVQVGELGKDENRIVCFETLHNPCLQPVPSVGLPGSCL